MLVGATKHHQLDDNLAAADVTLTPEDLGALDAASAIEPIHPSSDWIEPGRRVARALGRSR